MRIGLKDVLLVVGLAVAGSAAGAPKPVPREERPTVRSIAGSLRGSGLTGTDLADAAVRCVNEQFPYHSVWHLWESPGTALANGRGWSHQYNTVLMQVLEELGFEVRRVHAARVRGWHHPWFFAAHSWVKVNVAGRWLDACASRSRNRLGEVGFVPVSDELGYRRSTPFTVGLGVLPFVTLGVWRAWLSGRAVPQWIYRRRD